ncbi:MAG: cbb3-type cytochrome c oxidase subunit I [Coraliomargaritaceae bacterium]
MNASVTASNRQSSHPYTAEDATIRTELSVIDRSIRSASLFFTISAVLWLLIGTVFALIAAIKMHSPEFLAGFEAATFGRVRSAHLNAVALGWSNNAVYALCLWIMARLCRSPIRHGGLLIIAGVFWNLGVSLGIFGILRGDLTSVEWLEIPVYATPLLAISYILIGIWGIIAFRFRRGDHVYVSQWYFLAGLFWFPWLYVVAVLMILWAPAQGVVQSVVNWWFGHNALGLWYTPMALGAAYYLIPKVLGRPIYSYYLSVLGFWSLALFYNWAGIHHLIGGPVPVWLVSAGIVASIMMVVPVVVVGINHHLSVVGLHKEGWRSPTIRFVVFGAVNYTLVSLIGSAMSLRDVNLITHFTHFTVGHAHHGVYAFFTMIMFGGIYYMMPRMLHREWPSAKLIQIHFWGSGIGILVMVVALQVGGWYQGLEMNNAEIPFLEIVQNTVPWLKARTVSGVLITIGHIAFAINFFWMLFAAGAVRAKSGPTLLESSSGKEAAG